MKKVTIKTGPIFRTSLKCFLENGDTFTPSINLNETQAKEYYLNTIFNFGIEGDLLLKVVKVELIQTGLIKNWKW